MEAIRGVRLRKFKLRKIVLGVRMHFRHTLSGLTDRPSPTHRLQHDAVQNSSRPRNNNVVCSLYKRCNIMHNGGDKNQPVKFMQALYTLIN